MTNRRERWVWIPGYEGRYEIYSLGRVRTYLGIGKPYPAEMTRYARWLAFARSLTVGELRSVTRAASRRLSHMARAGLEQVAEKRAGCE